MMVTVVTRRRAGGHLSRLGSLPLSWAGVRLDWAGGVLQGRASRTCLLHSKLPKGLDDCCRPAPSAPAPAW